MSQVTLRSPELVPVVEVSPLRFSSRAIPTTAGADEWHEHWRLCLVDAGIAEMTSVRTGSWYVPTVHFKTASQLRTFLRVSIEALGGFEAVISKDEVMRLDGGFAFRDAGSSTWIEPGCCGDLSNLSEWKIAAAYRDSGWETLWIGHPWLSVRYEFPNLILSHPHETTPPVEHCFVPPDELNRAIACAEREVLRFRDAVAQELVELGYQGDAVVLAGGLVGLQ
jgi:hypothetical protein